MADEENTNLEFYASIHAFDTNLETGQAYLDDDGEELLGYYFQIMRTVDDTPASGLIGPYNSRCQVEKAAQRAFTSGDF